MRIDENLPIDEHIIHQLRQMATTIDQPVELLYYLKPLMSTEEAFVEHMVVAFYSGGLLWTATTRWWNGDMRDESVNLLLSRVLDQTRYLWSSSE